MHTIKGEITIAARGRAPVRQRDERLLGKSRGGSRSWRGRDDVLMDERRSFDRVSRDPTAGR